MFEIREKEKQNDIFNILHDGDIIDLKKNGNFVEFVVAIEYLAELIDAGYTKFYGRLNNCTHLSFLNWDEQKVYFDLGRILEFELEILSGKVQANYLEIICALPVGAGGILRINADSISIFDEGLRPMTHENLAGVCEQYWNQFPYRDLE